MLQHIRTRFGAGYVALLVMLIAILATFAIASNRLPVGIGLLTLCILVGLVLAHGMLLRLQDALRSFAPIQGAAGQEVFVRVAPAALPRELLAFARSYNEMVDRLEQRQQSLQQQLQHTALLTRLALELRETFEPTDVIHDTLTTIVSGIDATGASILLVGPDGTAAAAMEIGGRACMTIEPERVQA